MSTAGEWSTHEPRTALAPCDSIAVNGLSEGGDADIDLVPNVSPTRGLVGQNPIPPVNIRFNPSTKIGPKMGAPTPKWNYWF